MGVLLPFLLIQVFVRAFNTIARKGQYDKDGQAIASASPGIAKASRALQVQAGHAGLELKGRHRHCLGRHRTEVESIAMTQTTNRFFDEIGRLMNDAAGAAQGVKREVDNVMRHQAERILRDLDIVQREEFEAVKEMARLAREENEALKARIAVLEAKAGGAAS
jgi:BMFP domain-containing protein YqiC